MNLKYLEPLFLKKVNTKTLITFLSEWFQLELQVGNYYHFTILDDYKVVVEKGSYHDSKVWIRNKDLTVQTTPELVIQNIYDHFSGKAFDSEIDKQKFLTLFYKISSRVVDLPTPLTKGLYVQSLLNQLFLVKDKDYIIVCNDRPVTDFSFDHKEKLLILECNGD